jgi:nicotinamidase-related amidase
VADVVIVVDMLRGFLEREGALYCGDAARDIIPRVRELLTNEIRRGSQVFYVCDNHLPDDLEFRMFPRHCVEGTQEAEIIPELIEFPGEVVRKRRYSAFFGTNLDEMIRKAAPGKLIMCGVCTSICVLFTVADARNRDYEVEVPADCVADFDADAHNFALRHMEKVLGARIIHPPLSTE